MVECILAARRRELTGVELTSPAWALRKRIGVLFREKKTNVIKMGQDSALGRIHTDIKLREKFLRKPETTLADFLEVNRAANSLGEKILKGEDWLLEAEAKIANPMIRFLPGEREALSCKVRERKDILERWIKDQLELEDELVKSIDRYLEWNNNGRPISIYVDSNTTNTTSDSSSSQTRVVFSRTKVAITKDPVWTPEEIAFALRISINFFPDLQVYSQHEFLEFIAKNFIRKPTMYVGSKEITRLKKKDSNEEQLTQLTLLSVEPTNEKREGFGKL